MGMVRVELDHGYYDRLDAAMRSRGYATTVLSIDNGDERAMRLPPGHYWMRDPTDEEEMRDDAKSAVEEIGALGAQIVATAGLSAWWGLMPETWQS